MSWLESRLGPSNPFPGKRVPKIAVQPEPDPRPDIIEYLPIQNMPYAYDLHNYEAPNTLVILFGLIDLPQIL